MINTIIQYIHRPNNTELGKGNTHDCYLLIPSSSEAQEIINTGSDTVFSDLNNDKTWTLKATNGREFRINKLSDFYYENDIEYGDEVILQKHILNGVTNRYIGVKKTNAIGLINLNRNGEYEIASIQKYPLIRNNIELNVIYNGEDKVLKIIFLKSRQKRQDSPIMTDIYNVYIDGNLQIKSILLFIKDSKYIITDYNKLEYHKLTWEE